MSSRSSSPSPVSTDSTVSTLNPMPMDDAADKTDDEECVLSQGRICICSSCEQERQKLELSRKRRRTSRASSASASSASLLSPDRCHEVGKPDPDAERLEKMTSACKTILTCIGEDPNREGLLKTPERWAKALLFMTSGYALTREKVINDAVFTEDSHKEIVVVRDIDIHSMCEHHMVPFTGRIHVGYIPNGKSECIIDVY